MSPRKKDPEVEVAVEEDHSEEKALQEADDFLNEPVNQQEFNEFIENLARNAAERVVQGLEQRVKDLEMLLASPKQFDVIQTPSEVGAPDYDVPEYRPGSDDVPEYTRAHQQDDGVPWYRG